MTNIKKIKNYISTNDFDKAISILYKLENIDNKLFNCVILVKARYNKLLDDKINGILDYENEKLEIAKINNSLIEILNRIESQREILTPLNQKVEIQSNKLISKITDNNLNNTNISINVLIDNELTEKIFFSVIDKTIECGGLLFGKIQNGNLLILETEFGLNTTEIRQHDNLNFIGLWQYRPFGTGSIITQYGAKILKQYSKMNENFILLVINPTDFDNSIHGYTIKNENILTVNLKQTILNKQKEIKQNNKIEVKQIENETINLKITLHRTGEKYELNNIPLDYYVSDFNDYLIQLFNISLPMIADKTIRFRVGSKTKNEILIENRTLRENNLENGDEIYLEINALAG